MKTINYFGTDLRQAGHYFFEIHENGGMYSLGLRGLDVHAFNPEGLIKNRATGEVNYITINELNIIAISGSPFDKRGGCESVFWIPDITMDELKTEIINNQTSKKILEGIGKINW